MRRETPVDLPETFNFPFGLRVESRRPLSGVLAILNKNPQGRACLAPWCNPDETGKKGMNRWFTGTRPSRLEALDLVYANGDHSLNAVQHESDAWKVDTIEPQLMVEMDH